MSTSNSQNPTPKNQLGSWQLEVGSWESCAYFTVIVERIHG